MPWDRADWPHNVSTGHHYRGLNFLNLCIAAPEVGYGFSTEKAWVKISCRVKAEQDPEIILAFIPRKKDKTKTDAERINHLLRVFP
jgi:hypothetical protein